VAKSTVHGVWHSPVDGADRFRVFVVVRGPSVRRGQQRRPVSDTDGGGGGGGGDVVVVVERRRSSGAY